MSNRGLDPRLAEMARSHHALIVRARQTTCKCPSSVLNLGATVAYCAAVAAGLPKLQRFVDEAVVEELLSEHHRLADDLDLLQSLADGDADSPDIEPLAGALIERIKKLLEREEQVLYKPLLRIAAPQESDHGG